jgi:hypothetical protein
VSSFLSASGIWLANSLIITCAGNQSVMAETISLTTRPPKRLGEKMMKRATLILTVLVLGLATVGQSLTPTSAANTITPAFDVTGIWSPGGEDRAQFFQEGTEVQYIYINKSYAHYATGRYISRNEIKVIQTRRERSTGCQTTTEGILKVTSATTIATTGTALDFACDLSPGPLGSGALTKVL